jgi:hypothetical protein
MTDDLDIYSMNQEEFIDNSYSEGEFDPTKFNKLYNKEINKIDKRYKDKEEEKLDKLEIKVKEKKIYQLNIAEIIINTKNTFFDIMNEILKLQFNNFKTFIGIFTKNNRVFYIGILLLLFSFLFFLLSLTNENKYVAKTNKEDINIYLNLAELNNKKVKIPTKVLK